MAHDHSAHSHPAHDHDPNHGHEHGHGHSHDHAAVTADSERRIFRVMLLTGGFMLAEVIGGLLSGSLALLADAGHMLTDAGALGLAWFAFRMGRRPSDARRSYGYHRFQVLAAFVNGLALFAISAWIVFEAIHRLIDPVPVQGTGMLTIAVLGLLVNLASFLILHRGHGENLNVRGAALHVLADLLGSVAAIVAALIILDTGWTPIDPILSVLVVALILRGAWRLTRRSGHILIEGTPEGLDPGNIGKELRSALPELNDVHHVHAWSLTSERHLVTLHAVVDGDADRNATLTAIREVLSQRFGIDHATIQLEQDECIDAHHGRRP
jgi:cobalt-zinc-cadmium efflux system protein